MKQFLDLDKKRKEFSKKEKNLLSAALKSIASVEVKYKLASPNPIFAKVWLNKKQNKYDKYDAISGP